MHNLQQYIDAIPLISVDALKAVLDKDLAVWQTNLNLIQSVQEQPETLSIDDLVTEQMRKMENFGDQQALIMHQIAETWIKGDENLSPTLSKSKSLFSTKKV